MAHPLGFEAGRFCDTHAYESLRRDQYLMGQPQRDARAIQHKLARDIADQSASELTSEAMQAARIRAARALQAEG